ncbi:hypothetical protein LZC95_24915 [Pendulispora brunnea]|uniref:Uncharacterized protein n=1 Tax=Pendulispora brunnea TaxID=2905690 RepID=A0ABZ2KST5_9BACT
MISAPDSRASILTEEDDPIEHRPRAPYPKRSCDSSALIFHDPDRPDADWTEEAETLPMRPRLLSFHAVEALLDAAFPQVRQLRRKRAARRSEIDIPTRVRPDLTASAALSKLNHALTTNAPTIREKPPDRSGVVRAVSKKNATWLAWVVRIPAAVALGILFGTLIAIFIYGEDIVFRDLESAVDAPPRASVEPASMGPPAPLPLTVSIAPVASSAPPAASSSAPASVPPPVKKIEKTKKPAATPATSKEKTKDTKVTTPPKAARPEVSRPETSRPEAPRTEARVPQAAPPVADKTPAPINPAADDKAMKREKALAEAARKLAEGQLSQSLAR